MIYVLLKACITTFKHHYSKSKECSHWVQMHSGTTVLLHEKPGNHSDQLEFLLWRKPPGSEFQSGTMKVISVNHSRHTQQQGGISRTMTAVRDFASTFIARCEMTASVLHTWCTEGSRDTATQFIRTWELDAV